MLFIKALTALALSAFAVASPVTENASPAAPAADAVAQDGPYGYGYGSEHRLSTGFCRKFGDEKEEHCKREVRRCDKYRDGSWDERECYEQVERKYRHPNWREYKGY